MFDSVKAQKLFNKLNKMTHNDIKRLRMLCVDVAGIELETQISVIKYNRYITTFQAAAQIDQQEKAMEAYIRSITMPSQTDAVFH